MTKAAALALEAAAVAVALTKTTTVTTTKAVVMTTGDDGKYAISHRFTIPNEYAPNRMIMISFDWYCLLHSRLHASLTHNRKMKTE